MWKKLCLRNEKGNLWLNPIQTVTDISTYIYIWYCNTSSLWINFSIKKFVWFVLYVANVTVHFDLTLYVYVRICLNIPCWHTWFQFKLYISWQFVMSILSLYHRQYVCCDEHYHSMGYQFPTHNCIVTLKLVQCPYPPPSQKKTKNKKTSYIYTCISI